MIRNLFRPMKLRNKILFSAVLSMLLIVGAAAYLGLHILSGHRELLSQATQRTLDTVSGGLNSAIGELGRLTYKILGDSTVQAELARIDGAGSAQEQLASYHTLYNRLILYQHEYSGLGVGEIVLVTGAYDVTTAYTGADAGFQAMRRPLIEAAAGSGGTLVLEPGGEGSGTLYAARAVRQVSPFDLSILGTMIVTVDMDRFIALAGGEYLWMMDRQGVPFYRSEALTDGDVAAIAAGREDQILRLSSGHYFVSRGTLPGVGWGYSLLVSCEEQWRFQRVSYAVFLAVLAFAAALAVLISGAAVRSITRRMDALLDKISGFQERMTASGVQPLAEGDRGDEIDILHSHFDGMAARIQTLVQEKYVSELLSKEAQLQALEAQINPHFLYNVLETVNSRARLSGNRAISAIVEALGRLLRVSLDTRTKTLTLRQELGLVRDYITIQEERFEDQLRYTEDVPPDMLEITIPKMIIQPLVENAIKYAVENGIDDTCDIRVSARREGGEAVLLVSNSGSQFPEEMLGGLRPDAIVSHGLGIGLANIHRRLQLTYGPDSGITLQNEGDSAVCLLRIPQA